MDVAVFYFWQDQSVGSLGNQNAEFARITITELCPETNYKTMRITPYTTAFEVIVKLAQKYTKNEDAALFYLTEVMGSSIWPCVH